MSQLFTAIFLFFLLSLVKAQTFTIADSGLFIPQQKKVILYNDAHKKAIMLFKTNLQVNTDGIALSYHPYDLKGENKAINTVLNAVAIYRLQDSIRISNPRRLNSFTPAERTALQQEALGVFEKWRDSNYDSIPVGYGITWRNVLIADSAGKPCIFKYGEYAGYFASATSLKNDITGYKGECNCLNQIDPLKVAALVLPGGNNIVKKYGAKMGDLVIAYNTDNKTLVYAIIGDGGPEHNLGEGSVFLNMQLLGKTEVPQNRKATYALATRNNIIVGILPGTNSMAVEKPYTQENIQKRITAWFNNAGINTEAGIKLFLENSKTHF